MMVTGYPYMTLLWGHVIWRKAGQSGVEEAGLKTEIFASQSVIETHPNLNGQCLSRNTFIHIVGRIY